MPMRLRGIVKLIYMEAMIHASWQKTDAWQNYNCYELLSLLEIMSRDIGINWNKLSLVRKHLKTPGFLLFRADE